jgi:protein-L-isoaspartate(D-aspartate) O-methyltransferase
MDLADIRHKMVEEQIRGKGIKDELVLAAMRKVPRHRFVEQSLQEQAYNDYPLPIFGGQTISQPYMVALMTECLQLKGDERVLEVGTGSGYQAAILAEIADKVYSIERDPHLARTARELLSELNYMNVIIKVGDGTSGWREFAPFDGIIVTAGSPVIPQPLQEQLRDGGRLVVPVGSSSFQNLMCIERKGSKLKSQEVCGCTFVPLIGNHGWKQE